jgi:hypothetical protein
MTDQPQHASVPFGQSDEGTTLCPARHVHAHSLYAWRGRGPWRRHRRLCKRTILDRLARTLQHRIDFCQIGRRRAGLKAA